MTAGPGIQLPFFENEAAEAQWWYDHREEHAAHWIKAIREGYVGEGSVARYARKMREAEMAKQLPTQVPPAPVEEHTSK